MGVKESMALAKKQQEITKKVFSNSVLKDTAGKPISSVQPGGKYLLFSNDSNKKIGWVRLAEPGKASIGWVKLPDYLTMKQPEDTPSEFKSQSWDTVDPSEYGVDMHEVDRIIAEENDTTNRPKNEGADPKEHTDSLLRYINRVFNIRKAVILEEMPPEEGQVRMDLYRDDYEMTYPDDNLDTMLRDLDNYATFSYLYDRTVGIVDSKGPGRAPRADACDHYRTKSNDARDRIKAGFEQRNPGLDFDRLTRNLGINKYDDPEDAVIRETLKEDYVKLRTQHAEGRRLDGHLIEIGDTRTWKANRRYTHMYLISGEMLEAVYAHDYDTDIKGDTQYKDSILEAEVALQNESNDAIYEPDLER